MTKRSLAVSVVLLWFALLWLVGCGVQPTPKPTPQSTSLPLLVPVGMEFQATLTDVLDARNLYMDPSSSHGWILPAGKDCRVTLDTVGKQSIECCKWRCSTLSGDPGGFEGTQDTGCGPCSRVYSAPSPEASKSPDETSTSRRRVTITAYAFDAQQKVVGFAFLTFEVQWVIGTKQPSPTSTATMTPTPGATVDDPSAPIPANTPILTATATAEAAQTATAVVAQTGTAVAATAAARITASATPTFPCRYAAPKPALPADNADLDTLPSPILQWTWDGTLAADEYFDVRVWRDQNATHNGIAWTKDLYRELDRNALECLPGNGSDFWWSIAVVRGQIIADKGRVDEICSPESAVRRFTLVPGRCPHATPLWPLGTKPGG